MFPPPSAAPSRTAPSSTAPPGSPPPGNPLLRNPPSRNPPPRLPPWRLLPPGRTAALRLLALSTGAVFAVTSVSSPVAARPLPGVAAEPGPSAGEVAQSRRQVGERAAEVGRTKAMLAQASGELDRSAVAAEVAAERYNGEMVRLERSQQTYLDMQARAAEATRRLDQVRTELAVFAASAYRAGTGLDGMSAAIAGNGGPQGFMDRAGMVEMLARRRVELNERFEAFRNVAEVFRGLAQTALDEQRSATQSAAEAKSAAQLAFAQQRTAVQRIGEEKRRLERRLGSAQAHAASVQRARAAALERAETQRAQRTRRAYSAAPPADSTTGTERGAVVVQAALEWLGTPYSWGGGTVHGPSYGIDHGARIHGFDCSGLALYAWNRAGVRLDHWTGTQWTSGPHVPLDSLRPGDLVFFARNTSDPDTIHHVGIYFRKGRMIEAPYTGGRVRISSIHRDDLIGATRPAG